MAFNLADRVKETSLTLGTGSFALAGAVPGYVAFSAGINVGDTTWYAAVGPAEFEVGFGTLTAANILARTTVYSSSNANGLVNFSGGSKDVFIAAPSQAFEVLKDLQDKLDAKVSAASAVLTGPTTIQGIRVDTVAKGGVPSGTVTFDLSAAAVQTITVAGAQTWALTGWGPEYSEIEIVATNAGNGTITFPSIKWLKGDGTTSTVFADQGVALQTSGVNHFLIWSTDGGATIYGRAA